MLNLTKSYIEIDIISIFRKHYLYNLMNSLIIGKIDCEINRNEGNMSYYYIIYSYIKFRKIRQVPLLIFKNYIKLIDSDNNHKHHL